MRSAASCCQPLQEIAVPRGARTGRGPRRCDGAARHASMSQSTSVIVRTVGPAKRAAAQSRRRARAMSGVERRGRASSGGDDRRARARAPLRRAATRAAAAPEVEPLRGAHQLDREHVPHVVARRGAACHAAPIAIGTTSSLLPSVGIESTLAGCDSTLHSLASAAAVTCAIMKPEFDAGVAARGTAAAPG